MGQVWLALDTQLNDRFALKFLPEPVTNDAHGFQLMRREAQNLLRVTHEHIVRLLNLEHIDGHAFLVMEYLRGPTLLAVLQQTQETGTGGLLGKDVEWALEQIAPALDYAHGRGMLHLDLKPSNLMLTDAATFPLHEGKYALKLTDFGVAARLKSTMTSTGVGANELLGGTLGYAAPELLLGKKATAASDIYSLGATLYHLVAGRMPFSRGDLRYQTIHSDAAPPGSGSDALDRLLLQCLDKSPANRPQSASSILTELRRKPSSIVNAVGAVPRGIGRLWAQVVRQGPGRAPAGCRPVDGQRDAEGFASTVMHEQSGIEFRLVQPGEFFLGSADDAGRDAERPRYRVRLSRRFYLATTPVTVGQWRQYARDRGYHTDAERGESGVTLDPSGQWFMHSKARWSNPLPMLSFPEWNDDHPVSLVSWTDASRFCEDCGFRLPTEAEWEYACRAGTTSDYWWGDDAKRGQGRGNFADRRFFDKFVGDKDCFPFDDGFVYTSPVRAFQPNPWGFHDMLGNVAEWCQDAFDRDFYQNKTELDPQNIAGDRRVLRGGSFASAPDACRSAHRSAALPDHPSVRVGFRPVIGF
ncbi:MAG: SUMF1/EgtB/PvdO family nonheme iron enzyme [Planctomycetes bacterium]|nr:SUMF1/EgtB/PvdO family nonheme iron enzyme [Planctomycetota bacterium]